MWTIICLHIGGDLFIVHYFELNEVQILLCQYFRIKKKKENLVLLGKTLCGMSARFFSGEALTFLNYSLHEWSCVAITEGSAEHYSSKALENNNADRTGLQCPTHFSSLFITPANYSGRWLLCSSSPFL